MQALLLAGGKANRLRPLTDRTPKAMTPLLNRPFLEHVFSWLAKHDVQDVTLLLGHLPGPIRSYFGDGYRFGVKLSYLVEESPLGSGGAIKQLERSLSAPFLAINADIFTDLNLKTFVAAHQRSGATVSMYLTPVADPSAYGVADLGADGRIRRFVEKPPAGEAPSNLINAGVWLFQPEALTGIAAGRFTMVEYDLFPGLAAAGALHGYQSDAYWMDAGTTERYLQLQRDLLAGRAAGMALIERPDWPGIAVQPSPGASDGEGRPPRLADGALVEGAVALGAETSAGSGALLHGPLSIGAGSVVGSGARCEDSIIWERCQIGEGAQVRSSILASGCVIGAGAVLDGCVLGDDVRVGAGRRIERRSIAGGEHV